MITTHASTTGGDAISKMISDVVNKYDADKDGRLSTQEFGSFLTNLLGGQAAASASTQDVARTNILGEGDAPASSGEKMDGNGPYRFYLAGFDHNSLDNAAMQTTKYRAGRIFADYKPMPENLPAVVDRLQAIGINAQQVSFDKIDFGDGFGPIDVIQGAYPGGGVAWQWLRENA